MANNKKRQRREERTGNLAAKACAGPRFDKRMDAADDLNTVGLQFMGGQGNVPD